MGHLRKLRGTAMELYDGVIREMEALLSRRNVVHIPYDRSRIWRSGEEGELVLKKDTAFTLGGGGFPSLNVTCVTSSGLFTGDEVAVCGPDLPDLSGDCAFARISLLETEEAVGSAGKILSGTKTPPVACSTPDPEALYRTIREMDYVKYHVNPHGYMVRVSAATNEEEVRVSKAAMARGIRFSYVGGAYIQAYRKLSAVKHVRVIFVTEQELVEALRPFVEKTDAITKTLSHILDGLPADCTGCVMKTVCDEVEGMREMHRGMRN